MHVIVFAEMARRPSRFQLCYMARDEFFGGRTDKLV